jgi:hypothetical protein
LQAAEDLDAEEVGVRAGLAGRDQERALAEADFDLDRVGVAENGGPVD